jgi:hypothetical protein
VGCVEVAGACETLYSGVMLARMRLSLPAGVRSVSCKPLPGPLDRRQWLAGRDWIAAVCAPPPIPNRWTILRTREQVAATGASFRTKRTANRIFGRDKSIPPNFADSADSAG